MFTAFLAVSSLSSSSSFNGMHERFQLRSIILRKANAGFPPIFFLLFHLLASHEESIELAKTRVTILLSP